MLSHVDKQNKEFPFIIVIFKILDIDKSSLILNYAQYPIKKVDI